MTRPPGARLRRWRQHRGFSQLALASVTATTARHISFLETGRSRPRRGTVLRFRIGGAIIRTIAMTARFDHAADVPLDELRTEPIYPLDADADHYFQTHHLAAS